MKKSVRMYTYWRMSTPSTSRVLRHRAPRWPHFHWHFGRAFRPFISLFSVRFALSRRTVYVVAFGRLSVARPKCMHTTYIHSWPGMMCMPFSQFDCLIDFDLSTLYSHSVIESYRTQAERFVRARRLCERMCSASVPSNNVCLCLPLPLDVAQFYWIHSVRCRISEI